MLTESFSAVALTASLAAAQPAPCTVTIGLSPLAGVSEASGVAVSRENPGIIWSHNDSGKPMLFAFDGSGHAKARIELTGASVIDWEDMAVGACREGSCLYLADIGDNNRARQQITIYRVREPRVNETATRTVQAMSMTYPDGAHDAEALFVMPNAQLFLVTKESAEATALYRVPTPAAGTVGRLEQVSRIPLARVTGASTSPDGRWVALRTNTELVFYPAAELTAGKNPQPRRFSLSSLKEPQGEGVAWGTDGLLYLVSEGGGRGGRLAAIRCTLH